MLNDRPTCAVLRITVCMALMLTSLAVSSHASIARAGSEAESSPIQSPGLVWLVESARDPQTPFPGRAGGVVLTFDASGSPHVLVAQACAGPGNCPNGEWYDAQRDENGWRLSGPIGVSETIGTLAAAFSASNRLHVVYQKALGASVWETPLIYAVQTDLGWQREAITDTGDSPSLVLDPSGQPHIAFRHEQGLHYARRTTSGWHYEVVTPGDALTFYGAPALALDAANQPAIWATVYRPTAGGGGGGGGDISFIFAQRTLSGWNIENISLVSTGAGTARLYLDALGNPHAVFARTQPSTTSPWITQVEHVWRTGGAWQWERASVTPNDQAQLVYASIAIDPGGRAAIAFNDLAGNYSGLHLAQLVPRLQFALQASPASNVSSGDAVTHTLTLSASVSWDGRMTIPIPVDALLISGSLTSTLSPSPVFSLTANAIVWQGIAPTGTLGTIGYSLTPTSTNAPNASLAEPIVSRARLSFPGYAFGVERVVIINGRSIFMPFAAR